MLPSPSASTRVNPRGVVVSSDGTRAYVVNANSGTVSVIDTATNTVIKTITVGSNPQDVAVSPDGTRAYVTDTDGTVSVVNTATGSNVVTPITVDGTPVGVVVSPDGKHAYVTDGGGLSVIDTATNTVVGSPFYFYDPVSTNYRSRFYRARLP